MSVLKFNCTYMNNLCVHNKMFVYARPIVDMVSFLSEKIFSMPWKTPNSYNTNTSQCKTSYSSHCCCRCFHYSYYFELWSLAFSNGLLRVMKTKSDKIKFWFKTKWFSAMVCVFFPKHCLPFDSKKITV